MIEVLAYSATICQLFTRIDDKATFFDWQNTFLAPHYLPEPDVASIPVEPVGEVEPFQSRGQRRKRSLQDNTGRLAS